MIVNPGEAEGKAFFLFGLPVPDLSFLDDAYCVGVFRNFLPDYDILGDRLCAIISEFGGYLSHGAIIAREFGIPYVVLSKATERFFFGDFVRISPNGISRRESDFYTSGYPPYPGEPHYSVHLYRYSLALLADWVLLNLLASEVNLLLLFGDTRALDIRPSAYYQRVKSLKPGEFDLFLPLLGELDFPEYLILVNLFQRVPHAFTPEHHDLLSPHLIGEDLRAKKYYSRSLRGKTPAEIFAHLEQAAERLLDRMKELYFHRQC